MQPQWVYDSINFSKLLNVKEYEIAKVLHILFRNYLHIYPPLLTKMIQKDISQSDRKS